MTVGNLSEACERHESGPIEVVAALIRDRLGRVLLVRKRGTDTFMQPGGKREPGEDDLAALARELSEEIGCGIKPGSAVLLGTYEAAAAHEPGRIVRAAVYEVAVAGEVACKAEIAELMWVDPRSPGEVPLAALTRDAVLPLSLTRSAWRTR
jgi:8-oxo-dGTP diphosphatase